MINTLTATSIGYIISAVLCIIVAWTAWLRRDNPGSKSFILMMCALSVWSIATNFAVNAEMLEPELIWMTVSYTARTIVGPLMLAFVLQFTRPEIKLRKSFYWALWLIPIISLIFAFTNSYHGLVFSNIQITSIDNEIIAIYDSGPVLYFDIFYVYILVLLGLYWLIRYFLSLGKKGVLTGILIGIASLIALGVHLTFILSPQMEIDVTPHTFSFLALVLSWGISQEQLFNIRPIAYKTLLESMPDSVLVLNKDNQIIKANPAALELLNVNQSDIFGKSMIEIAPYLCKYDIECFKDEAELTDEIKIPGRGNQIIRLRMQPIIKNNQKIIGKIIDLHDITTLKEVEEKLHQKYHFTETLINATAEINTTLELKNVLEKILENAAEVVPYDAADIVLVDDDGRYRFSCVKNFDKEHPNDFLLGLDPMKEDLYGFEKMVEKNEAIIISDTTIDPDWNPILEGTNWIRSYLGTPIRYHNKNIGFINLSKKEPNVFTSENAKQIQIFANYAASAISNANMFNEISQIAQELVILNEIGQAVSSGTGLEEIIQAVFSQLKIIIPVDEFGIALYNQEDQIVEAYLCRSDGSWIDKPAFVLSEKSAISQMLIDDYEAVYLPNVDLIYSELNATEASLIDEFESKSFLGTPLIHRDEIFGILIAGSKQPNAYNPRQLKLVEAISLQSSSAIDNARLYEKVQELSITDDLTGLDNRRHFNLLIDQEIERAVRYDHELSLIMLDIDHFKEVNDSYGHIIGDLILKSVAESIKENLRKADLAFRYGGEEFIIILPETDLNSAEAVAERIRSRIAEKENETEQGKVHITVSLGVCDYQNNYSDSEAFVNASDQALYQAKSIGRNRVCICTGK